MSRLVAAVFMPASPSHTVEEIPYRSSIMRKTISCIFVLVILLVFAFPFHAQDAPSNMAQVPAGEFWQGRVYMTLIDELGMLARARMDDLPSHQIYLDAFNFDKYEATNADYSRFVQATGHRKPYHWVDGKIPPGEEKFPVYNDPV